MKSYGAIKNISIVVELAAETLRSTYGVLKEQGIRLVFVMVWDDVKAGLERHGLTELVGEDAFYATGDDLLNAYRQETTSGDEPRQ